MLGEDEDDHWEFASDLTSSWSARICYFGTKQESFCKNHGLPTGILDTTWSASCLVELIGLNIHIADLTPIEMAL